MVRGSLQMACPTRLVVVGIQDLDFSKRWAKEAYGKTEDSTCLLNSEISLFWLSSSGIQQRLFQLLFCCVYTNLTQSRTVHTGLQIKSITLHQMNSRNLNSIWHLSLVGHRFQLNVVLRTQIRLHVLELSVMNDRTSGILFQYYKKNFKIRKTLLSFSFL